MAQAGHATVVHGNSHWASPLSGFGGTEVFPDAHQRRTAPEVPDGLTLMPLGKRVKLAFAAIPANRSEEQLIAALLRLPTADTKTLSEACGWSRPIWHTHFGLMCQKRVAWLRPEGLSDQPDTQFLPGMLADYDARSGSFRMKWDAEKVFRKMGLG